MRMAGSSGGRLGLQMHLVLHFVELFGLVELVVFAFGCGIGQLSIEVSLVVGVRD